MGKIPQEDHRNKQIFNRHDNATNRSKSLLVFPYAEEYQCIIIVAIYYELFPFSDSVTYTKLHFRELTRRSKQNRNYLVCIRMYTGLKKKHEKKVKLDHLCILE